MRPVVSNAKSNRRPAGQIPECRADDFRALVTMNADAMVVLDQEGHVLYVNPAAEALFDMPAGEMIGLAFGFPIMLEEPVELYLLRKFQKFVAAEMRMVEVVWSDMPAYLLSFRDLTERVKATEVLSRDHEALDRLVAERTRELSEANQRLQQEIAERKQVEASLQEAKSHFNQLFKSDLIGIAFPDRQGRFLDGNDEFLHIVGYSRDDLVTGRIRWDTMTPPEYLPLDEKHIAEADERGSCTPYEKVYIRKDGSKVPILIGYTQLAGTRDRYIAFIQDISKRKTAENTLRASEERFRSFFENVGVGIVIGNADRGYMAVNDRFCEITGYSREQLLKMGCEQLVHPEDQATDMFEVQRLLRGEASSFIRELRYIHANGSTVWVRINISILRNDETGDHQLIGVVEDITGRRQMEESLKLSSFSVDHARDMIFWLKPDGHFVYVNESACNRFGYTRDELLALTIFDINPSYTEESWRARWQMLRNTGSYLYRTENRTIDGSLFPIEISASYILFNGKEYLFAFARDITERMQAEEALKEAKQQAELYVDLMGHDINNMNQSAMGYLELASEILETDGKIEADEKELIEKPLQAVRSSSTLIDNVRKLQSLMTEGIKTRPVDLHDLFDELKAHDFHSNGNDVTVNFEEIPHYLAKGNELLRDVFYNLIGNSVKHSKPDEAVMIDVKVERDEEGNRAYYRCIVEDNGPGIPDELKPRLFHRLQRGNTKAHGKGLGLYLIRTLVEGYHGKVWVEDRVPGDHTKGTRFIVMLQAAEK